MSITLVNSTSILSTGTTSPIDTSGANLLYLVVSALNSVIDPIDSNSNSFTKGPSTTSSFSGFHQLYSCLNPTVGPGHTFTNNAGNTQSTMGVVAFSNINAIDQTTAFASGGVPLQSNSITPSLANSLILAIFCGFSAASPSGAITIDSGFTIQTATNNNSNFCNAIAYLIQTAIASESPTWNAEPFNQNVINISFSPKVSSVRSLSSRSRSGNRSNWNR